jgi:hypothetical protein
MATKSRKTSAAKKSSRRTPAAKKAAVKKTAAKKGAARKAAVKKTAAKKGAARKAAVKKTAAKKGAARKATAKKTAAKKPATRAAGAPKAARRPAGERTQAPAPTPVAPVDVSERPATGAPSVEQVETTSAGIQPLAPEHAAVDELTSSGNELLDIFQRYDRNRTGSIERAEFARLLEALGQNVTDEELEIALDTVDTDRTGKISWREFKAWWTSR